MHVLKKVIYIAKLQVTLYNDVPQNIVDIYRVPHVGIRTIRLTDSKFLINERPFYFHRVNAHKDNDIRGKGFDEVILTKHFNLYGWMHGNASRTSHYPYADEFYQMADRFDIAIIGETPGVGLRKPQYFSQIILEHHKVVTAKIISRDRNHPSVLMLSLANEPLSEAPEAKPYFSVLANFTRPIAVGRPITFVISAEYSKDQCAQFFDMICVNRYFGWYSQSGRLIRFHR
jgi:beta-glucuronidase